MLLLRVRFLLLHADLREMINEIVEQNAKYDKLCALEASRVRASKTNPSDPRWSRFNSTETMNRDRFNDIFVWKKNRVPLRVPEEHCDYVNASPIELRSKMTGEETKYIAMQAPKKETTDHVWRMIWHEVEGPGVIVTLTVDKVHAYYPLAVGEVMPVNEDDEFGDGFHGSVTCESLETSEDGATQVRKLVMRVPKEEEHEKEKVYWHLLYTKWSDYGVVNQEEKASLLKCIELSRKLNKESKNPRVVHCRAGVGRSGTFMALDFLLTELEKGRFKTCEGAASDSEGEKETKDATEDPIFETVNRLREQRPLSVQTVGQYRFLYDMLKESWEKKYGKKVLERSRSVGSARRPGKVARFDVEDVFRD